MSRHGVEPQETEDDYKALVLFAYHDAICPDEAHCDIRENHTSQLIGNFETLKKFLDRLSELETEVALDAVR